MITQSDCEMCCLTASIDFCKYETDYAALAIPEEPSHRPETETENGIRGVRAARRGEDSSITGAVAQSPCHPPSPTGSACAWAEPPMPRATCQLYHSLRLVGVLALLANALLLR